MSKGVKTVVINKTDKAINIDIFKTPFRLQAKGVMIVPGSPPTNLRDVLAWSAFDNLIQSGIIEVKIISNFEVILVDEPLFKTHSVLYELSSLADLENDLGISITIDVDSTSNSEEVSEDQTDSVDIATETLEKSFEKVVTETVPEEVNESKKVGIEENEISEAPEPPKRKRRGRRKKKESETETSAE